MNGLEFINLLAPAVTAFMLTSTAGALERPLVRQTVIPRWRGCNFTESALGQSGRGFRESDFGWMAN